LFLKPNGLSFAHSTRMMRLCFDLNSGPEVTRYTHDPVKDVDHAKQVLEEVILPQYALYNFGRWAVHQKHDLLFMGWCGLKFMPARNEIDLGYRFKKEFWGKGYATESARATIHYGFSKLNLEIILGRALRGNLPSINVLEKCGMTYVREEIVDGWLHKTYKVINPVIPHNNR
jgi:ribosomal-protein-alanine N-acetyltransferase